MWAAWRETKKPGGVFVAIYGLCLGGGIFELIPAANQLGRMGRWGLSALLQQSKH